VPWATFDRARFAVIRGRLAEYRSSAEVVRGFCAACGTSLTYHHQERGQEIDIALATLDMPAELRPAAHIWVKDKLPWVALTDGLPEYETVRHAPTEGGAASAFAAPAVARPGYHIVTPRIVARDAAKLVEFLRAVFGARGDVVERGPTELRIGDALILVSEAVARDATPAFLYVYVNDADATYHRALAAGARSLEPPAVVSYGDRRCMVQDAWGNVWQIATPPR
jgi:PhnB protein